MVIALISVEVLPRGSDPVYFEMTGRLDDLFD